MSPRKTPKNARFQPSFTFFKQPQRAILRGCSFCVCDSGSHDNDCIYITHRLLIRSVYRLSEKIVVPEIIKGF